MTNNKRDSVRQMSVRATSKVFSAVIFGTGLASGATRALLRRLRGSDTVEPPAASPPPISTQPREVPVPTPPTQRSSALDEGPGVTTPVGTTGAAPAYNPSTAEAGLQQPGTEQILEPSTAKAMKKEAEMMRRAAERNPD